MRKEQKHIPVYSKSTEDYQDQFRQIIREAGLYDPYTKDQIQFLKSAPTRAYKKILKRIGKYTFSTAFLLFLFSFWKKIITTVFGKVTVITVATTVTVTTGYYVKKHILDVPQKQYKKIEIKQKDDTLKKTAIAIHKPKIPFGFSSYTFDLKTLGPQKSGVIQNIFFNALSSKNINNNLKLEVMVIAGEKFTISIKLVDIVSNKCVEDYITMVSSFNEVEHVCNQTANTLKKKYF